jgi:pilus assembly protein CpaE
VTQIALLSADPRLPELLRPSGLSLVTIDEQALSSLSGPKAPAALVFDLREQRQLPPAVATFRRQNPECPIVLLLSSLDGQLMLDAMRAGVSECVAEPLTATALEGAIRRVMTQGEPLPAGQVFAFVGAKGGVGTTTLAVNTAAALAPVTQGGVLLIDLHLSHGDAAVFLGAEPRFSVVDALENVHRLDHALFTSLVETTGTGLDLLASSSRSIKAGVESERPRTLIDYASHHYGVTVLDVPRSDMSMLDALDVASSIVVVASQELGSLRNAGRMAVTLRQRYGASRVRVVVSRFDSGADLGEREVEKAIGGAVSHLFPSDYRSAVEALNTGRPVVTQKDQKLARAFRTFATQLAGIVRAGRERPGLLSRLTLRRA